MSEISYLIIPQSIITAPLVGIYYFILFTIWIKFKFITFPHPGGWIWISDRLLLILLSPKDR